MKEKSNLKKTDGQRLYLSVLIFTVSLVALIAVTVAWFSIADFTRVNSMRMEITSGTNLRFDLDPHDFFDEYVKTLGFQDILARIKKEKGFDISTTSLAPVTSEDYVKFTYEDGTLVKDTEGAYLEFTLHFMATSDMYIHLTTENSKGQKDGTLIASSNQDLPAAMRIAFFADEKVYVYDPGLGDEGKKTSFGNVFGLAEESKMKLSDDNKMFFLKKDENKPVQVRIWLEGTDPLCTDDLRNLDYSIRLRFVGTDENNVLLDGTQGNDTGR